MKKQVIELQIKYLLHECSAPKGECPINVIKIDPRAFDIFRASKIAHETGGWILYFVDSDRIKLQHAEKELWTCIYLRHNIN